MMRTRQLFGPMLYAARGIMLQRFIKEREHRYRQSRGKMRGVGGEESGGHIPFQDILTLDNRSLKRLEGCSVRSVPADVTAPRAHIRGRART